MDINPLTLTTILAMALVTYTTRIGGIWLMGKVTPSPRVEAWLRHLPGAILVSIVAPAALSRGPAEVLAVLGTGLAAWWTKNLLIAMLVGVALVVLFRRLLGGI